MGNTITYRYAYVDDTEEIIDINDVTADGRKDHKYKCISCGHELIACKGEIRVNHFRHKYEEDCNRDRYIHSLAERLFKKRFDNSKSFYISLPQIVKCSEAENCKLYTTGIVFEDDKDNFHQNYSCVRRIETKYDLKEHYDTCTIEKGINGFVADLLLEDSKGVNEPLLIEIFVTHECTEDKLKSGLRIFEIPIAEEQDAINLLYTEVLSGNMFNYSLPEQRKRLSRSLETDIYSLYRSGKFHHEPVQYKCNKKANLYNKSAIFVADSYSGFSIEEFYQLAIDNGCLVRSCYLCEHFKENIYSGKVCSLYKSEGTPHTPKHIFANICHKFKPYLVENIESATIIYNETDKSKKDCISCYKKEYGEKRKLIEHYISLFKSKSLKFKLKNNIKTFVVSDYYDTCNPIINEENAVYSLIFSSTSKPNYPHLTIRFVRKNEYLKNKKSDSKAIYLYDDTVADNNYCIYEDEDKAEFVNFAKTKEDKPFQSNETEKDMTFRQNSYVNDRSFQQNKVENDVLLRHDDTDEKESFKEHKVNDDITFHENEIDNEPFLLYDVSTVMKSYSEDVHDLNISKLKDNPKYYQNILESALQKFKKAYDDNLLKISESSLFPVNVKEKYPECVLITNPDTFYYSLKFRKKGNFLGEDLIIRFIIRDSYSTDDRKVKQIFVILDDANEGILEDNCIYPKKGKVEYYNF